MTTESRLTIAPVGNLQRFASADEHLVDLVAARPIAAHLRAYRADVGLFLVFVATPLTAVG